MKPTMPMQNNEIVTALEGMDDPVAILRRNGCKIVLQKVSGPQGKVVLTILWLASDFRSCLAVSDRLTTQKPALIEGSTPIHYVQVKGMEPEEARLQLTEE